MATTRVPFRRGRFEELPELPHRAHPYSRVRGVDLDLRGARAHVKVHGSGPPLLLVHGLMTSSYSWRYVLEPLGERFTMYMPDLPGNGGSAPLASHDPDTLAAWIGDVQRALGIRGCPVIGNSMGGYLAMRLALRDPEAMSRLVNVHSPGVPELRLRALGIALALPGVRSLLARVVRRDPVRWAFRNVHYYDESLKSLEEAREYARPLATEEGARAFVAHLAETMAYAPLVEFQRTLVDRRTQKKSFPVPLLLLYAERDPMVPPVIGDRLSALVPDARLVRLREASHFPHVDAVDRFLPPVLEFLAWPAGGVPRGGTA
jgi:pimeloyl-ACP methyl ester carboxylesterase